MPEEVSVDAEDQPTEPVGDAAEDAATSIDFSAWVASRGPALQRFAYLVTGNNSDAPDLVQDALIRAMPRWDSLAVSGTAEAYVKRSIVNGSISGWRKRRRLVLVDDVEPMATQHEPGPETHDADEAWALVQTLPANQRAAVVLRFYEDLSFAQIATVLDCAEATARSHVHRALAKLRDRLNEQGSVDGEGTRGLKNE
ncbi:RNA polymerase sigma-70 factor (sigma-E family) [Nocardioides albertanoniae]|uniref:RNA polymerase sigma-70 factor (Sigma-E family) n=1 Tax=Nocardioides albertanoniae TaxID=1175486 RepID=A0A543ABP4_9ACTN|nr:SigE family RNA polymerase sigma factor [Nocardioides albertanoniae]TQL70018.1 RNA polymerase sigma-70 factor (sigma-E family) [Nocardioides albertanoniae]